ncbi:MAG: hypothetical protein AAB403_03630 [Planctomycetota bacterium]
MKNPAAVMLGKKSAAKRFKGKTKKQIREAMAVVSNARFDKKAETTPSI